MSESIVYARKSIHERATLQRLQSEEDELALNDSDDQMPSGSDEQDCDEGIVPGKRTYKTREEIETSRSVSRTPRPTKRRNPIKTDTICKSTESSKKPLILKIISLVVILSAACGFFLTESEPMNCSFEILKTQYPQESSNLWNSLKVGIESILNKRTDSPAVYLFAHYGGQQSFQLIKDIAAHSSMCFGKKLIPMESDDFISAPGTLDDYGYAIKKYRNKIKEGDVILIANLNEIPAEAARALHALCDTHNPIAKNVVIFLTLTIQENIEGNPNAIAEETLIELWGSKIKRNELDPLITRVTDQVIILKNSASKFIN